MFIEDYHGTMHPIRPCPVCGGQPERDDCGPERQAVMCWRCGTCAETYDEIGTNAMLIEAIKIWNSGKEWETRVRDRARLEKLLKGEK